MDKMSGKFYLNSIWFDDTDTCGRESNQNHSDNIELHNSFGGIAKNIHKCVYCTLI